MIGNAIYEAKHSKKQVVSIEKQQVLPTKHTGNIKIITAVILLITLITVILANSRKGK